MLLFTIRLKIKKIVVGPVELWKTAYAFGACGKSVGKLLFIFQCFFHRWRERFPTFPQANS